MLVFGCAPSKTVNLDTKMIHNFFNTLKERYSKETLDVTFPDALDDMLASALDEKWEIWRSNKIQRCKIFYERNKVIKKIGIVLVHTHCKNAFNDLQRNERVQKGEELLKE